MCADYVHISLMSPRGQNTLGLSTNKMAQPNINAKSLAAILIPCPPLMEQAESLLRSTS
jgi:restriction endonuclease S subunit